MSTTPGDGRAEATPLMRLDRMVEDGLYKDQTVLRYVTTYEPEEPSAYWHEVSELVRSTVLAARPKSVADAKQSMLAVRHLAEWSREVMAMPIEPGRILDGYTIQQWALSGIVNYSETYQQQLIRRANEVAEKTGHGTRVIASGGAVPSAVPYTDDELLAFRSLARHAKRPAVRTKLNVLLGLSGGAGLTSAEVLSASVGDIHVDADGIVVTVRAGSARERAVPVLRRWEDVLRDGVRGREPSEPAFAGHKLQVRPKWAAAPTARRLRATWIIGHLNQRVPLHVLVLAAGLGTLDAWGIYTPHMRAITLAEARALLAQAELRP